MQYNHKLAFIYMIYKSIPSIHPAAQEIEAQISVAIQQLNVISAEVTEILNTVGVVQCHLVISILHGLERLAAFDPTA